MGRKLPRMAGSMLGFLIRGVTSAVLNDWGKQPSWKERFASLAIISENTEQVLSRDVGT